MNRDFMMMLGNMFGRKDNQVFSQGTMQELAQRLQTEKDFILLDVRTHEEFEEGHIPGAICIPNEMIAGEAATKLPNKDQLIFVYCHSGMRSMMSANFLANQGYTNVVECGGIVDWKGRLE
ncbi:MAG: rhodanese-like domain-containing protein [Spirochaetaceae bacterium]|nr:rhodanese-like domain-containing protein [Spirochaetaceae bacterium]